VSSAAASVGFRPFGSESESSGTLVHGVMPWWTGEAGSNDETVYADLFGSIYTKPGAVNSSVLSYMPFSASSSESSLRWLVRGLFGVSDILLVRGNETRVRGDRREDGNLGRQGQLTGDVGQIGNNAGAFE